MFSTQTTDFRRKPLFVLGSLALSLESIPLFSAPYHGADSCPPTTAFCITVGRWDTTYTQSGGAPKIYPRFYQRCGIQPVYHGIELPSLDNNNTDASFARPLLSANCDSGLELSTLFWISNPYELDTSSSQPKHGATPFRGVELNVGNILTTSVAYLKTRPQL